MKKTEYLQLQPWHFDRGQSFDMPRFIQFKNALYDARRKLPVALVLELFVLALGVGFFRGLYIGMLFWTMALIYAPFSPLFAVGFIMGGELRTAYKSGKGLGITFRDLRCALARMRSAAYAWKPPEVVSELGDELVLGGKSMDMQKNNGSPSSRICPRCRGTCGMGDKFCTRCGGTLNPPKNQPPANSSGGAGHPPGQRPQPRQTPYSGAPQPQSPRPMNQGPAAPPSRRKMLPAWVLVAGGVVAAVWAVSIPLMSAGIGNGLVKAVMESDSRAAPVTAELPPSDTSSASMPEPSEPEEAVSEPEPMDREELAGKMTREVQQITLDWKDSHQLTALMLEWADLEKTQEELLQSLEEIDKDEWFTLEFNLYLPKLQELEIPPFDPPDRTEEFKVHWLEEMLGASDSYQAYPVTCRVEEEGELVWIDLYKTVDSINLDLEIYFLQVDSGSTRQEEPEPEPEADPEPVALPFPSTGDLSVYDSAEYGILRFFTSTSNPTYIKIYRTNGSLVKTLFINSGDTYTTYVPSGSFIVKFASGSQWYGETEMFGDDGSYQQADTVMDIYTAGDGFEITLYGVDGGNLDTLTESKDNF